MSSQRYQEQSRSYVSNFSPYWEPNYPLYFCLTKLGYDSSIVMHVAIGSSLAMILFSGTSSAVAHKKRGSVDFKIFKIWVN